MNAEAILQKIKDDAHRDAGQIKADAEKKAAEMKNASAQKTESMKNELVSKAKAESTELADRMRRMAELETRKQLLQEKRIVLDEAFDAAKSELCAQPAEKVRAFMLENIALAAQGNEGLMICSDNAQWFDDAFVADLNAALKNLGKPGDVTLLNDRRQGMTGAVLVHGGTEVYVAFESMLESARIDLETEIATILFNS